MPDQSKLLLLDFFHLAFLLLAFGLLAFALIRRSNPLIRWHEHGNVWTQPFLKIDLVVSTMIVGVFYVLIFLSIKAPNEEAVKISELDNAGATSLLLANFVLYGMIVAGVLFVVLYVRNVNIVELFGLTRLRPQQVFNWSVGVMIITLPIVLLVSVGWGSLLMHAYDAQPEQQEMVTLLQNTDSLTVKLLAVFSACVFAPLAEEILFRGYFYAALKRFSERYFAAVVVSLLFAVVHSNTMSVVPLFVLAMSLTIAYELTGCLLVPIAMHAIFNSITVVRLFTST